MSTFPINLKRRQLLGGALSFTLLGSMPLLTSSKVQGLIPSLPDARSCQELVLYIGAEPTEGFDPCTGWGQYGYLLFQSPLLHLDHQLNIEPELAKWYQISDDGLTYQLALKEGICFSDGFPLTAQDVVFTYLTAKQSGSMLDLTMLESATVINHSSNESMIEFKLNRPWSTFLYTLAQLGIVPERHYDPLSYRVNPIGTGPFRVVEWQQGQQLIIEPNPFYYGQRAAFNKITILFLPEEMALAYGKAGLLDVMMVNPEYANEQVAGMQAVRLHTVDNRGFNLPVIAKLQNSNGEIIGHNVLCDPVVRRALNIGIDRKTIIQQALNGIGRPAFSRVDALPWANAASTFKDNRWQEANELLTQAGWQLNSEGIRVKNGIKAQLTINARTDDLQRYHLAIALAQNAAKLGIVIHAKAKSWSECKQLAKHQPCCWGSGDYNPQDLYYGYHSKGGYNYSSYHNPAVDNYMDLALRSTDRLQAIEYWQKSQWDGKTGPDSEHGDHPFLWLVNIDHLYFVRQGLNLGQQPIHPHGHGWPVVGNLQQWRWDK